MQLCVGDEFLYPLAKPSRSFQNLTETPPRKRVLLSSFCFPKVVKMATKNESRLTNKTFTPNNDLDHKFSIVKMLARDVTIFSGKKVSVVFFIYFKCCNTMLTYPCSEDSLASTYIYNKTGMFKGITYSSFICSKT